MSFSQDTLLELMAYADGELDGEAHDRVESLLATSPEARRVVASMASPAVGAWLSRSADGMSGMHPAGTASKHPADGIADAVMAKIEGLGAPASLEDARAKRAARLRFAAGVTALAAIAAAVLAYVGTQPGGPRIVPTSEVATNSPKTSSPQPLEEIVEPGADPDTTAQAQAPTPPQNEPSSLAALDPGIEVNEVESPSSDVSVFFLPPTGGAANANPTSVVIWIGDNGTQKPGGR